MRNVPDTSREDAPRSVFHPVTPADRVAMAALRATLEPNKGRLQGTAAREPYDAIMNRVAPPPGIAYDADSIGGISGWWCRPDNARPDEAIMHLHGGWFTWGSAWSFRHLVGQIAARTGVAAFIPDYRLAPEHPYPSAVRDAQACFAGLVDRGYRGIAITGDSAGGNLALLLLSLLQAQATSRHAARPVGTVVLSPVTDLALTGPSWETRAAADPYFTKPQVGALVAAYLNGHDPTDPSASPLYGDLHGLPPIRVHVGEDEVLLDDARRYGERAVAAGVDARVDVWQGMAHGFLSGIGRMVASTQVLDAMSVFLVDRLTAARV